MSGRRLLAVVAISALIIATGIAAEKAWETERSRAADQHRAAASEASIQAKFAFDSILSHATGSQGLAKTSGGIRHHGFRLFAQRAIKQGDFAAMTWNPKVPARRDVTFEDSIGRPITAPGPGGKLQPVGEMRYHLPVRLLEGKLRRRDTLGVDALAVPGLARAARTARDQAIPAVSQPLRVLGSNAWGVIVYRPVFEPGQPLGTVASRRRALIGEIGVALPASVMSQVIGATLPDGENVAIVDGGKPVASVGDPGDATQASVPVGVGGRMWTVSVGGLKGAAVLPPIAILIAGISLAALVGVLFVVAARREELLESSRREAQRAAAREGLLVRVGDSLERTVSIQGRLDQFARTIVPGLADSCAIDVEIDSHDTPQNGGAPQLKLRRVGAAADNADKAAIVASLPSPTGGAARRALETASVQLVRRADQTSIDELGPDDEANRLRGSLGVESMIFAPLHARDRVIGLVTLYTFADSARESFDDDDAALAGEIADRAALAIENARLYEQQLDIAQTLQRALLPRRLPAPDRLDVAARHRAGREGAEVGGDFYDFFDASGRWVAAVGDVCGKGAEAAALTGLVRHTLRVSAEQDGPANALTQVDRAILRETHGSTFCTLACATIDPSDSGAFRVRTAVAGHPEPLIIRAGSGVERVKRTGPLLGRAADASFDQTEITLETGDTLLLYTDGVTEARMNGRLFGEARLLELAAQLASLPLDRLLERLESEVVRFAGGHPQDDIALLAVRVLPPSS